MTFPTRTDVQFWAERQRVPQWARRLHYEREARQQRLSWYRADNTIHACINAHAGLGYVPYEASASALCSFIRGWRKRGEDIRANLRRLISHPGTVVNGKQRSRFARKWLARLERRQGRSVQRREVTALHVAEQPQQQDHTDDHVHDHFHDAGDARNLLNPPQDEADDGQHDQPDEQ